MSRVASLTDLAPEKQRLLFIDSVAGAIIHRINFPKVKAGNVTRKASLEAKVRPLLTPEEEADTRQTCALALISTGAFEAQRMTLATWKVAFRAVRGADCLRIDRKAKNQSEIVRIDTLSPEAAEYAAATQGLPTLPLARRKVIAKRARYVRAQMFANFNADKSRKRKARFHAGHRFLRFLLSHYKHTGAWGIGEVTSGNTSASLRMAHSRFKQYCEDGESLLTAESLAFVPARRERTLRAFSDIPENFAIAE